MTRIFSKPSAHLMPNGTNEVAWRMGFAAAMAGSTQLTVECECCSKAYRRGLLEGMHQVAREMRERVQALPNRPRTWRSGRRFQRA